MHFYSNVVASESRMMPGFERRIDLSFNELVVALRCELSRTIDNVVSCRVRDFVNGSWLFAKQAKRKQLSNFVTNPQQQAAFNSHMAMPWNSMRY
jgi:hypothetical protein